MKHTIGSGCGHGTGLYFYDDSVRDNLSYDRRGSYGVFVFTTDHLGGLSEKSLAGLYTIAILNVSRTPTRRAPLLASMRPMRDLRGTGYNSRPNQQALPTQYSCFSSGPQRRSLPSASLRRPEIQEDFLIGLHIGARGT